MFCFVYSYMFICFSFLIFSKWRDQKTVLKSLQSLNVVSEKTLLLYVREVRYKVHTYLPSVCNFFYTNVVISFQKRSKGRVLPCRNHNYSMIFFYINYFFCNFRWCKIFLKVKMNYSWFHIIIFSNFRQAMVHIYPMV